MAHYSDFWLIDRGQLSLLTAGRNKPYTFRDADELPPAADADPLPTSAELVAYAALPLAERQAVELAGYGFVLSLPDALDTQRQRRNHHKRAA